jgi:hypothetical protein
MLYKVGDRVRIRPAQEILARLNADHYDAASGVFYNDDMIHSYCGHIYTIRDVWGDSYRLEGCGWCWTDIAFAPASYKKRVGKRYIKAYAIWQYMMQDGFPESSYIAKFFDDVKYVVPMRYYADDGASRFEKCMISFFLNYLCGRHIASLDVEKDFRKWVGYLEYE